ncbi:MAG: peptidyl-prolyl cis-trans isomerase [Prevotellaceae bacterium]|jgi:hypothetical protein|nr:peptidyl-prolyl cis-trans isomerase [Prevotellaceae bacterium]
MKPSGYFFAVCFLISAVSCFNNSPELNEHVLVQVDNHTLLKATLRSVVPSGLSSEDSARYADSYVRSWIEDILLYDVAAKNIPNSAELNRLVDNYRRTLIIQNYQQELIRQRVSMVLPEQELQDYYAAHSDLFLLERPLIKGLFIKVPLKAPQLANVRRWYKDTAQVAVDELEKYSLRYSLAYEYFYDRWLPLDEILGKIPLKTERPEEEIRQRRQLELQDTTAHYFLNVTGYLGVGDVRPYDYARPLVLELLLNRNRTEYIRQIKADLYEEALEQNRIISNLKPNE